VWKLNSCRATCRVGQWILTSPCLLIPRSNRKLERKRIRSLRWVVSKKSLCRSIIWWWILLHRSGKLLLQKQNGLIQKLRKWLTCSITELKRKSNTLRAYSVLRGIIVHLSLQGDRNLHWLASLLSILKSYQFRIWPYLFQMKQIMAMITKIRLQSDHKLQIYFK